MTFPVRQRVSRSTNFSRGWVGVTVCCLLALNACAMLPDTEALIAHHTGQAAQVDDARGPIPEKKAAAILDRLKQNSGAIDILDKQIALEQSIVGSPLVVGNKATLLRDGPATYAAMFAAIGQARDHVNLESYIFEDDEVGEQFAQLLVEFNPINPFFVRNAWRLTNRDHRKLLVVDGKVAFLGGINISSVYSSGSILSGLSQHSPEKSAWRDTHLQIDGPVVAEFQKLFLQTWQKQHGPELAKKDYFPVLKAQGKELVRAIGSTPDDPFSLIYLTLISAIGNAENQIYLTTAYFVPDPQLLKSLVEAATRGVDVKLILPSRSDSAVVFHAGRAHYTELLQGGVKVYEHAGALLHAKTAVIDGVWSTVGSTNLDWRSFLDNDEINAVVLGREFAQKMQVMFDEDLASSQPIDLPSWNQRPIEFRLKEWMAQLWRRLL